MTARIVAAVGARPNFMKIAPILNAAKKHPELEWVLVHTGQHFDSNMSAQFLSELNIASPGYLLDIGNSDNGNALPRIMSEFDNVLRDTRPDLVVVVGDVTSTLACALSASLAGIELAHVEAGLRSFDLRMPEEHNRVITDALSGLLFTTTREASQNLVREGIAEEKIHFVGNVMIDTLYANLQRAQSSEILTRLGIVKKNYALVTMHRPSNVDSAETLTQIMLALGELSKRLPVVFPLHPRTRKRIAALGIDTWVGDPGRLQLIDPLGYLDFVRLMSSAALVVTDSGGVQEETTGLGVPCLTVRENTERPITISQGSNRLVNPHSLIAVCEEVLTATGTSYSIPELWDGKAAVRIVENLTQYLDSCSIQSG